MVRGGPIFSIKVGGERRPLKLTVRGGPDFDVSSGKAIYLLKLTVKNWVSLFLYITLSTRKVGRL